MQVETSIVLWYYKVKEGSSYRTFFQRNDVTSQQKKDAAVKFSATKETMKPEQVINQDPDIHGGVLVFTGTRVPIQSLIDHLKAGESLDYFLEGFPSVSREQAIAFLEFALTTAIRSYPR
jgi:uncharacterized protein (DUF433 family)